jgi:hypothetical protein
MRCPVCKAENAAETTCRRCRADLSLLVSLEQSRQTALAFAANAAAEGDGEGTLEYARRAHFLRPDCTSWRWLAIGYFLTRNFSQALAHYQHACSPLVA